ncbi:MAG: hypothetical protein ACRD0H_26995 [Actinomycetes bacterium]
MTSRDVTELLHCLAHLRWGVHGNDTPERTAFLHRKAQLFTRIADQYTRRDPSYSAEVRQLAADALAASGDDIETTTRRGRCPVCHTQFTPIRRQRFCSDSCRKTAWRRRHNADPPTPRAVPAAAHRRDHTIYACPECDTRYHAQQRCADCNTWCTRVGPGGLCPHCDEPVAVTDLIEPLHHRRPRPARPLTRDHPTRGQITGARPDPGGANSEENSGASPG